MSATGLEVFDRTLQTTNIWLGEIMREVGTDRQAAWKVLSVVLHRLRDRLPVELSTHLGAQLPLLVRGLYYDQHHPARQPGDGRTLAAFIEDVAGGFADSRPVDPKLAVQAVFHVLSRHVPHGQIAKVRGALPSSLRTYWEGLDETEGALPRSQDGAQAAAAEI